MTDEDEDYIKELYSGFIDALADHTTDEFDREELIEIHDYANDLCDSYISFMSLSIALNRFPDDTEIAERLAVYLYNHNESDGTMVVAASLPDESFIKGLMEIATNPSLVDAQTAKRLNALIKKQEPGSLDDEAVIRLMEVVQDLQMQDWAFKNYKKLKLLAEYPDTLMSEISHLPLSKTDGTKRLKMVLEDFTTEYPFNVDAWLQLSDLYLEDKPNFKLAENAINYALAIEPLNYKARFRLLDCRFRSGAPIDILMSMSDSMLADFPEKAEDIYTQKGLLLQMHGKVNESETVVREGIKKFPRSQKLYDLLLGLKQDADVIDETLTKFETLDDLEFYGWLECMIRRTGASDFITAGVEAALIARSEHPLSDNSKLDILEALYRGGQYQTAIAFYSGLSGEENQYQPMVLIYLLSLKQLGMTDKLAEELDTLAVGDDTPHSINSASEYFKSLGVCVFIGNLKESLTNPDIKPSDYDPYQM